MDIDVKNLLRERVRLDGKDKSLRKVKEELSELLVAISHYEDGKADKLEILSETVDVSIQCEKLRVMFDDKNFYIRERKKKYDYLESITY